MYGNFRCSKFSVEGVNRFWERVIGFVLVSDKFRVLVLLELSCYTVRLRRVRVLMWGGGGVGGCCSKCKDKSIGSYYRCVRVRVFVGSRLEG